MRRHVKRRNKRTMPVPGKGAIFFLSFILFILLGILGLKEIDVRIMPTVLAVSRMEAQNRANDAIDRAVQKALSIENLKSEDFLMANSVGTAMDSMLANTMLINQICSSISGAITEEMEKIKNETIDVPFGIITGIEAFSNMGPKISFTLLKQGSANVDYETAFESVGINQTNFKIWLNVDMKVQIVNPLKNDVLPIQRKLMLVDMIIRGEVPEGYLNIN